MDGVALAARFSLATNRLEFCGPADAEPALYASIISGSGSPKAREALRGFEALYPYLELIGSKHGLDPLDARVVEAYWIGNDLLDAFDRADFRRLLDALQRRGLPRSVAIRLNEHLPDGAIPHHAFHVSYVGVGAVTGHVETTIANMDLCRPSWATVRAVDPEGLDIVASALTWRLGTLMLGEETPRRVAHDPHVLPGLVPGSIVALHWRWPALELTPGQAIALGRFTERSFAAASPSLHALYPDALPSESSGVR